MEAIRKIIFDKKKTYGDSNAVSKEAMRQAIIDEIGVIIDGVDFIELATDATPEGAKPIQITLQQVSMIMGVSNNSHTAINFDDNYTYFSISPEFHSSEFTSFSPNPLTNNGSSTALQRVRDVKGNYHNVLIVLYMQVYNSP
jgi:hypothetical protein